MLIGEPGARKSSAIKDAKRLFRLSGYNNFSADKTRLEKFLLDLEGVTLDEPDTGTRGSLSKAIDLDTATLENLWGDTRLSDPKEVFIAADEWTDFAPRGDTDFYSLLGNLWDWDDDAAAFTHRLKNSKSVSIFQPTVSILGGITPEKFANVFPNEVIGGGFLSRLILIHGVRSGRKFTIPPKPDERLTEELSKELLCFRTAAPAEAIVPEESRRIFDDLYNHWEELEDSRFKGYNNRRFTQLLKLCLILAVSRGTASLGKDIILTANTYLTAAEIKMPEALGEFGKSRNADVANKVVSLLLEATRPMSTKEIWKFVQKDLEKITMLADITNGLQLAGKIQLIAGAGWLPLKKVSSEKRFVNFDLLTEEERNML